MSDYGGTEAEALSDWYDDRDIDDLCGIIARPTKKASISKTAPKKRKASKSLKKDLTGIETYYVKMRCHCGIEYQARRVDLMRRWGLSCSKRCASIRREYGRPRASVLGVA